MSRLFPGKFPISLSPTLHLFTTENSHGPGIEIQAGESKNENVFLFSKSGQIIHSSSNPLVLTEFLSSIFFPNTTSLSHWISNDLAKEFPSENYKITWVFAKFSESKSPTLWNRLFTTTIHLCVGIWLNQNAETFYHGSAFSGDSTKWMMSRCLRAGGLVWCDNNSLAQQPTVKLDMPVASDDREENRKKATKVLRLFYHRTLKN